MKTEAIFLAAITLIGTAILVIFGISALPKIGPDAAANSNQARLAAPLETPTVLFGNPVRGPETALVDLVVFGDYQCLPCEEMDGYVNQLLQEFPDDLRIVWKDFPVTSQHQQALKAAMAARCAGLQGMFWEYHDLLMANQTSINDGAYPIFASQLGLDEAGFSDCLQEEITKPVVERDFEEGLRLRIDATPYIFINMRRVSGALRYELLREMVRQEIDKAKAAAGAAQPAGQP